MYNKAHELRSASVSYGCFYLLLFFAHPTQRVFSWVTNEFSQYWSPANRNEEKLKRDDIFCDNRVKTIKKLIINVCYFINEKPIYT